MNRGFTLIEVLVALGILSIAALALLNVQSQSAIAAGAVRERLLAEIVAENQLIEALTAPEAPVIGSSNGDVRAAGEAWQWTQTVARTGDRQVLRVDVAVRRATDAGSVLSQLSAFRGAK